MSSANYLLSCFGGVGINPDLVSISKTIGMSPRALINGFRLKMPLMEVCLHEHGTVRQQGREPTVVKPGHSIELNSSAFSDLENSNQMAKIHKFQ